MAEQRGHRRVAANRGAVDLNEGPGQPTMGLLEFVDPPGEEGLPGARRAEQQDRGSRTRRHPLQTVDQVVEPAVTRRNPRLQQGRLFDGLLSEA